MLENDVKKELPRYLGVLKWTGLGAVALGTIGAAYGYLAKDNLALGTSLWMAGVVGITTLSIYGMQYITESNRREE